MLIFGGSGFRLLLLLLLVLVRAGQTRADVPDHAVIFMYHHVSDTAPVATSVSPALFEEHLEYLEKHDFRVWDLARVVRSLRSGETLPDSVVVFTFDDGYRSVYSEAFPRLRRRGWPFTVFVCTDAIDNQTGPVLSWNQLREMASAGATIASHGQRHRHLQRRLPGESPDQWRQRTLAELRRSSQRILAEIGREPDMVAYPYGEFDDSLLQMVEQLGWTGFGQQSGAAGRLGSMTALPRFPMAAGFASMTDFPVKAASLPLPVLAVTAADPVLKFGPESVIVGAEAPVLRLTLAAGEYRPDQLAAFASGQGPALVRWVDRPGLVVEIRAGKDIPPGRSRYNVTAPSREGKRWYWYSYTWIAGDGHGD